MAHTYRKIYKFDLDVKDQHDIGIVNVRDTSTHCDRLLCQIRYANIKVNRSRTQHVKSYEFGQRRTAS